MSYSSTNYHYASVVLNYFSGFKAICHVVRIMFEFLVYILNYFLQLQVFPQGSILGPLLFLIFVNDIASCVKKDELLLFADNIKMFKRVDTPRDCNALQHDVNNILQWFLDNLLVNPTKTNVISLSRRHAVMHLIYFLGGTPMERVIVMKDLGVCLDGTLPFSSHVFFLLLALGWNFLVSYLVYSKVQTPYFYDSFILCFS